MVEKGGKWWKVAKFIVVRSHALHALLFFSIHSCICTLYTLAFKQFRETA